ncbi:hypothetical protein MJO28_002316 [Puccinia striiformis f. sp. tritici]|uniref:Uncharacterized protein n=1 Tax=Puccinia striiformis f. sp. tritici TaxID=168172 RepID=A0ACC0EWT4_9BASI|nr:hypothetical protein MJO28_002316 [Puccinia striiformis f. sp. tritici]
MTSDYSEFSGSDDEPFSPPSDDDSDSSKLDDNKSPLSPKDRRLKKLLVKIFKAGHQGPAAIRILLREHDITISPRHLARKRKEWNLQKRHLRQTPIPVPLSPEIRASILSSHSKGLNLREMNARLYADTGLEVGHHTVQRYLKKLGLTLLPNDILDGKVIMDQVYNAIHDARNNLLQNNTGYCRMRMVLMRHYNIRVPRDIIYEVLKEIDPEGMAARLRQACKRRIYRTLGPNHIWACDGHDKLKPFGITVYGFVDAWSRKLLGILLFTSRFKGWWNTIQGNNRLRNETVDMAAHQMTLSLAYAGISKEEAEKRMHCTKSTHNQEIEAMWSQMMKQHNRPIKDDILAEINSGCYDKDDGVQKLLFLFLWIPVFQASVDIWVDSYNHYRKRFDKLTTLPTGCTPDFAYTTPESFGTTDQLVRIPSQHIDCLSEQFYPDKEEMFLHTPLEFHEVASSVVAQLGFHFLRIDFGNVWIVFHHMLPYVQEQYVLYTDSSDA